MGATPAFPATTSASARLKRMPTPCTATPLTPDTLDLPDTPTHSPDTPAASTMDLDTPTFSTVAFGVKPKHQDDDNDQGLTNQTTDIAIKLSEIFNLLTKYLYLRSLVD